MPAAVNPWTHILKIVARHVTISLSTMVLFVTLVWQVGRPHLEGFVREIVESNQARAAENIQNLTTNVNRIDSAVSDLRTTQIRQAADLDQLKELGRETRSDIKQILFQVKR